jgi:hypothetical protein
MTDREFSQMKKMQNTNAAGEALVRGFGNILICSVGMPQKI